MQTDVPRTGPDHPEVFEREAGEPLNGFSAGMLWFKVPAGVERFWIEFPPYRQLRSWQGQPWTSLWDPDGRRRWSPAAVGISDQLERVEFEVPPEQADRLWRLSFPADGLRLDPQIPPVYAADRTRWFLPE